MLFTLLSSAITMGLDFLFIILCRKMNWFRIQRMNKSAFYNNIMNEGISNNVLNSAGNTSGSTGQVWRFPFIGGFKWQMLVILLIVSIVVFILIFHSLTRNMVRNVESIKEGIQKFSMGEMDTVIEVDSNDEFAVIADGLNHMTKDYKVLREKEKEAEVTKNELITNVAHDLRTPLTSIIGYLGLLKTREDLTPEDKQRYLNIAFNKSKKLENLINDLFSFTKISLGKMPIEKNLIDIVKLLEQQIEEFYPSFSDNHLNCEFRPCESSTMVVGDGNLIARAFENLIGNAIKYGKDGKVVKIITRRDGSNIKVIIINYGSVIPQEDLPYVFDKFYRVEQSRHEETGGTGLGLAIAKGIIEGHGGTIECRSTMSGTAFEVGLKIVIN